MNQTNTSKAQWRNPRHEKRLTALASGIEDALEDVLPKEEGPLSVIHEAMRYCVFPGGKRFRPLLVLGGCEAVGASLKSVTKVACAIELIHCYSLVHDDLPAMDDADFRRGKPTCHRKFGEGNAILAGDALLTYAFELLSSDEFTSKALTTIAKASGTTGLIGGQVMDLETAKSSANIDAEIVREIARHKTAALIEASVVAGGIVGGGSDADIQHLTKFGRDLGISFQLIDDVHDGDGLAAVHGIEAVRSEAGNTINRAKSSLEPFGKKANILMDLVSWLEDAG